MKNEDGEEITIEDALDDIEVLIGRARKALTYPEKLPTRKKFLQSTAKQLREAADIFGLVVEEATTGGEQG